MISLIQILSKRKIFIDAVRLLDWESLSNGKLILTETAINQQLKGTLKYPSWLKSLRVEIKNKTVVVHLGLMQLPEFSVDLKVLDFRFNPANHYLVLSYDILLNPLVAHGAMALLNRFVFDAYDFLKVDQKNGELTLQFSKIKGFDHLLSQQVSEGTLAELITLELLDLSEGKLIMDLDVKGFSWT